MTDESFSALTATYTTTAGGAMNYMWVAANKNATNMHHFAYAVISGSFKKADDVFVIGHETASFFGDSTSLSVIRKPAGVSIDDYKPIFAFFKVIAFTSMGNMFGLSMPPLPDLSAV